MFATEYVSFATNFYKYKVATIFYLPKIINSISGFFLVCMK